MEGYIVVGIGLCMCTLIFPICAIFTCATGDPFFIIFSASGIFAFLSFIFSMSAMDKKQSNKSEKLLYVGIFWGFMMFYSYFPIMLTLDKLAK